MNFIKPTLITITAPTCAGKSVLLEALSTRMGFQRIVSTTTRDPRQGEIEGLDYYFISHDESKKMEEDGEFAELIEFRGNRYGVTHSEMVQKLIAPTPPVIILEPKGLEIYRDYCAKKGIEVFSIFVSVVQDERIKRLNARTCKDMINAIDSTRSLGAQAGLTSVGIVSMQKILEGHTSRLQSILGEERHWQNLSSWDAIVPGNDLVQALADVRMAISWRNRRNAELSA